MGQGQPAVIFMQEHERRAADAFRRRTESCRDSTYKRRFAGSQRT